MRQIISINRGCPGYPERLLSLDLAPERIWVSGRLASGTSVPCVAIVGARAASASGVRAAFSLARALAQAGVTVISGGAVGIDAAAHGGALTGGGSTLVVVGTGADVDYPRRHAELYRDVVRQGGGILSIFPLGTPAKPWHFPARNRIIAALCDLVIVVEAQVDSGSRSTALSGRALGRPVAACAGSPGTDQLLHEGALAIATPGDALRLLGIERGSRPEHLERLMPAPLVCASPPLLVEADTVKMALDRVPRDLSDLSARTGLPAAACAAAVVDLELRGLCARITGGRYVSMAKDQAERRT